MITGVTKAEQVLANAAAADWVLSVDDLVGIEAIVGVGVLPVAQWLSADGRLELGLVHLRPPLDPFAPSLLVQLVASAST